MALQKEWQNRSCFDQRTRSANRLRLIAVFVAFSFFHGTRAADDGAALVTFKSWLGNPDSLKDWVGKVDPCKPDVWPHITCTAEGRVMGIDLQEMELEGSVPAALGDLSELTRLNLQKNRLSGPLPRALAATKLKFLHLADNTFSGEILEEFSVLADLEFLFLQRNHFSGSIPKSLGKLSRLLSLNLSGNQLVGSIPSELGNCPSLEYIYLNDNYLSGSIPESLAHMRQLQELVLANNSLQGSIPAAFATATQIQRLDVSNNQLEGPIPPGMTNSKTFLWSGNSKLIGEGLPDQTIPKLESPSGHRAAVWVALPLAFSVLIAFSVVLVLFCSCRRKRTSKGRRYFSGIGSGRSFFGRQPSALNYSRQNLVPMEKFEFSSWRNLTEYTYAELAAATKYFGPGNEANQGPAGTVFWGTLPQGPTVIVKKIPSGNSKDSKAAFKKQRDKLGELYHPNLGALLGYCASQREHLMVFERPANGTLRGHLSGPLARKDPIDWTHRLEAAVGIAGALSYLHNEASYEPIVYGQVASSNILLDNDLTAKLSGLALCKSPAEEQEVNQDLEEGRRSSDQLSTPASDVFAFGLVLLEIFTGNSRSDSEHLIMDWARPLLDLDRISAEMDRRIPSETSLEALQKLAHAALRCVAPSQKVRPNIEEVLQELKVALALHNTATGKLKPQTNEASRTVKLEPISRSKDPLLDLDLDQEESNADAKTDKLAVADVPTSESVAKVAERLREKEMTSLGVAGVPGLAASPGPSRNRAFNNPFGGENTWTPMSLGPEDQPKPAAGKPAWMLD